MRIRNRRPAEDVETERARIVARADAAGHEETVRRAQRNADRQDRNEERRLRHAEKTRRRRERAVRIRAQFDAIRQRLVLLLPLIFVNILALAGQIGFATDHLGWNLPAAVMFGATLESIAVYIGWHAHQALLSGDSAIKLRASSYFVGAIVGGLNYEHFAGNGGAPTVKSAVFGLMSLISPWLWAMHGRYANRKRLRDLGLIDERAPHFSGGRWVHFPAQTLGALRWGIANNVQDPAAAWDGYQKVRRSRAVLRDKRPTVRVTVTREVAPNRPTLVPYRIAGRLTVPTKPRPNRATAPRTVPSTKPLAAGSVEPNRAIRAPQPSHTTVPSSAATEPTTKPSTEPVPSGTVPGNQTNQATTGSGSGGTVPPEVRPGVKPPEYVLKAARKICADALDDGREIKDRKLATLTREHFNAPHPVIGRSACASIIAEAERAEATG